MHGVESASSFSRCAQCPHSGNGVKRVILSGKNYTATVIAALAPVLAFAIPAGAQDDGADAASKLPSGVYAYPSCEEANDIWVVAAGLNLTADKDYFFIADWGPEDPVLDHGWRRIGWTFEDDAFVRVAPDDSIEWASPTERGDVADELPKTAESAGESWTITRYAPCEAVPFPFSLLHGEAAAVLLALDAAVEPCSAGAPDCLGKVFSAFDKWPDGELRVAELSRAMRLALYLGVATGDSQRIEKLVAGTSAAVVFAPLLAMTVIASYDYDGSDSLSFEEIGGELQGAGRATVEINDQWSGSALLESLSEHREFMEALAPILRLLQQLE